MWPLIWKRVVVLWPNWERFSIYILSMNRSIRKGQLLWLALLDSFKNNFELIINFQLSAFDAEVSRLMKKREDIMSRQQSLARKYEALCKRLGVVSHSLEGIDEKVCICLFLNKNLIFLHFEILDYGWERIGSIAGENQRGTAHIWEKTWKGFATSVRIEKVFLHLFYFFNKKLTQNRIYDSIQLPNNSIGEEELQCLRVDLQCHSVVLSQELLNKLASVNQRVIFCVFCFLCLILHITF